MLMQKRPLLKQSKKNLNKTYLIGLYWVGCSLLKKYSVIKHTIEQYTVNEVNVNSYDIVRLQKNMNRDGHASAVLEMQA